MENIDTSTPKKADHRQVAFARARCHDKPYTVVATLIVTDSKQYELQMNEADRLKLDVAKDPLPIDTVLLLDGVRCNNITLEQQGIQGAVGTGLPKIIVAKEDHFSNTTLSLPIGTTVLRREVRAARIPSHLEVFGSLEGSPYVHPPGLEDDDAFRSMNSSCCSNHSPLDEKKQCWNHVETMGNQHNIMGKPYGAFQHVWTAVVTSSHEEIVRLNITQDCKAAAGELCLISRLAINGVSFKIADYLPEERTVCVAKNPKDSEQSKIIEIMKEIGVKVNLELEHPDVAARNFLLQVFQYGINYKTYGKRRAEQASTKGPQPGEGYDLIVDPSPLLHAYNGTGWRVNGASTKKLLPHTTTTIDYVRVALIGIFNSGKTFILQGISGKSLFCGPNKHTKGLSFLHVELGDPESPRHVVLCDTCGLDSGTFTREVVDTPLNKSLEEYQRQEHFIRRFAIDFAQVYIWVIEQLSHTVQCDFLSLPQWYASAACRIGDVQMFVIHNLKDWSYKDFECGIKERGQPNYCDTVTSSIPGSQCEIKHGPFWTVIHETKISPTRTIQMEHLFLTDDTDRFSKNHFVFDHLRERLMHVNATQPINIGTQLHDTLKNHKRRFCMPLTENNGNDIINVAYSEDDGGVPGEDQRYHGVLSFPSLKSGGIVQFRPNALERYLQPSNESVPFRVIMNTLTKPVEVADNDIKQECTNGYLVQLECPGLDSFDKTVEQTIKLSWCTDLLRIELKYQCYKIKRGDDVVYFSLCAVNHMTEKNIIPENWETRLLTTRRVDVLTSIQKACNIFETLWSAVYDGGVVAIFIPMDKIPEVEEMEN